MFVCHATCPLLKTATDSKSVMLKEWSCVRIEAESYHKRPVNRHKTTLDFAGQSRVMALVNFELRLVYNANIIMRVVV